MPETSAPSLRESTANARVDDDNPWLGLAPFGEANQRFFFGRSEEIRDLFLRVHRTPLTVLYGQSGLGKTSLLGAGLIPRLRAEGYRPFLVRLRFDEGLPTFGSQVRQALKDCLFEPPAPGLDTAELPVKGETLWEALHRLEGRSHDLDRSPPVLVLDQFEELFTLGKERRPADVEAFMIELADAVENRPPAALRERFKQDRQAAVRYDFAPAPLRVVLTLREDYLSNLDDWRQSMPSVMRNRMSLQLLRGPQALEAVVEPGRVGGHEIISPAVGAQIVRFVARQKPDVPLEEIDAVPPLVSLVCRELNNHRIETRQPVISEEQLAGRSEDILAEFYERCFAGQPPALRHFVEDRLLTAAGFRGGVPRETAETELAERGVPGTALDDLIRGRLLSSEERRGLPWLELTHDVLAPLVARSRGRRREREARERVEREAREALERAGREAAAKEEEARERAEEARRMGMLEQAQAEAQRRGRLNRTLRIAVTCLLGAVALVVVLAVVASVRWKKEGVARRESERLSAELAATNIAIVRINSTLQALSESNRQLAEVHKAQADQLEVQNTHLQATQDELKSLNADLSQATKKAADEKQEAVQQSERANRSAEDAQRSLQLKQEEEKARRRAEYNAYLSSASLLGQLENYAGAARALEETTTEALETVVSPQRLAARNLVRWFVESHSRSASLTNHAPVPLRDIAVESSGQMVIAVGEETPDQGGFVGVYQASPEWSLRVLPGHNKPVTSVAISSHGWFVTGDRDQRLLQWQLPAGPRMESWRAAGPVEALTLGDDGRWIISGGVEMGLEALSTSPSRSGSTLRLVESPAGVTGLSLGPDRGALAATTTNGTLLVWRRESGGSDRLRFNKPRVFTYISPLLCVAEDPNGVRLATGAEDGTLQIWDLNAEGSSRPWRVLGRHRSGVVKVAFHPDDGDLLVSAGQDATLRLWDIQTGQTLRVLEGHEGAVTGVAATPRHLFSCSSDKTWRQWAWGQDDRGYQVLSLTNGEPSSCVISPDGARVIVGADDGTLASVSLPVLRLEWQVPAHKSAVTRLVFLRRGRAVASAGLDGSLKLWDATTGTQQGADIAGPPAGVTALAVSSENDEAPIIAFGGLLGSATVESGRNITSSGIHGVIHLLNTANGEVTSWPAHQDNVLFLNFNRQDGTLLSTGEDGLLLRWDVARKVPVPIQPNAAAITNEPHMSAAAIFSPTGRWIAHVGRRGSADLLDLKDGGRREFLGHENTVLDAVFTEGEGQVFTVSTDATIRAWDLSGVTGSPLLFTLRLPVREARGVPVRDFDYLPRSSADGKAWLAVPLAAPARLIVYSPGRIEAPPSLAAQPR